MIWVKIDDGITEHPKCVGLSPAAWMLWLHGLTYSSRNLTDGHIPAAMLPRLCTLSDPHEVAAELVSAGLWDAHDGGWEVHDYGDHQRTREEVERSREEARERRKRNRSRPVRANVARTSEDVRANVADTSRERCGPESETETDHHHQSVVSTRELSTGRDDDERLRQITDHLTAWAIGNAKSNPQGYAATVVANSAHELAEFSAEALTAELERRWPLPPTPATTADGGRFLPGSGVITEPGGDPIESLSPTARAALDALERT